MGSTALRAELAGQYLLRFLVSQRAWGLGAAPPPSPATTDFLINPPKTVWVFLAKKTKGAAGSGAVLTQSQELRKGGRSGGEREERNIWEPRGGRRRLLPCGRGRSASPGSGGASSKRRWGRVWLCNGLSLCRVCVFELPRAALILGPRCCPAPGWNGLLFSASPPCCGTRGAAQAPGFVFLGFPGRLGCVFWWWGGGVLAPAAFRPTPVLPLLHPRACSKTDPCVCREGGGSPSSLHSTVLCPGRTGREAEGMSWHVEEPEAGEKCCSAGLVALPASRIKGSWEAAGSALRWSRLEHVGAAGGSWGAVTHC
ncbi:uncharacterized protein LOC126646402 [Myiozetetes cayanensis]|uniref:uncharacterized protein LOC126646402 n=1 Tax=Myiozetetes cayanensis TaxID=478635 RepID=UPI00215F5555|nr:uncharacterized protein LOC126646402 [Myiozetetes cayanensis]XP_050183698.1 uncharacterized protein LOC126646402 [Myiozetetes cayanensis]XP_050183699.1 uncharacterized protein LOC126646402 [Myiozetetes cayanensis]